MIRRRVKWKRFAFVLAGTAAAYGCGERASQIGAPVHPWSHADSVADGAFDRPPAVPIQSASIRAAAAAAAVGVSFITPWTPKGAYIAYDQKNTETAVFTGPVGSVTVTGNGAIQCSGSYGSLIALDATGATIATSSLHLIDPSDCSPPKNPDNVTYGASAVVVAPAGKTIASAKITPMSPFLFDVLGSQGAASQVYAIQLTAGAPAETLVVVPTSATRKQGQTMTFAASAKSGHALTVTSWSWAASGTPQPGRGGVVTSIPSSCHTSATCTLQVHESGKLTVYGTVAGLAAVPASATLTVLPCDANTDLDPFVHNPSFRKIMRTFADSNTQPNEKGLDFILKPSDSTFGSISHPNIDIGSTKTSPCNHYSPDMKNPSGALPDSFIPTANNAHTHPWAVGDTFPGSCVVNHKASSAVITKVSIGPSKDDYKAARSAGFVGWIVDKNGFIYRFNYPGDRKNHSKRWTLESDANGVSSCFKADTSWHG